jgi:hypothetical protein
MWVGLFDQEGSGKAVVSALKTDSAVDLHGHWK